MRAKDCIEIAEDERLGLAEEFDRSCLAALSELVPPELLKTVSKDGTKTLEQCQAAFKRIDKDVFSWLNAHSMTLKSYYSAVALYTVKRCGCTTFRQCRSYLKAIMRNPTNQRGVLAYVNSYREELGKNKEVLRSLMLSITRLCDLTFNKDRVSRPSLVLQTIIDNGSLGRYLGGTLSYHFMALVPNIGEIIEKTATTHVDIRNIKNRVMDDEFALFYDSLEKYKHEAVRACKCITGNPISIKGVLPFTDEYYYKKYLPEHSGATITSNV